MSVYIRVPLAIEPADVVAQMQSDLRTRLPGWEPNAGLDTAIIEVQGFQSAVLQEAASGVTDAIYRYAGATLFGVLPNEATYATADSTWVMRDTAGYIIPAGTEVQVAVSGDEGIGFQVVATVVVAPGSTSTVAGAVQLIALEPGAAGSGLTGNATLVTPLDGVSTITIIGTTIGGRDEEEDAAYLDRLTRRLRRLTFGVVTVADVQDLARDIPGVARALVIDNYIPAGPGGTPAAVTNAAAALTVVPISTTGQPVSAGVKAALVAELAASREQGFLFSTMDPTYTTINATFSFTTYPGYVPAVVRVNAEAALAAYLSPATWGLPPFGDQALWLDKTYVRFGEVYAVLNAVEGLDEVTALTLNSLTATDIALGLPAPLPNPGTITGTAV